MNKPINHQLISIIYLHHYVDPNKILKNVSTIKSIHYAFQHLNGEHGYIVQFKDPYAPWEHNVAELKRKYAYLEIWEGNMRNRAEFTRSRV
jgi:hypothetical protein